MMTLSQFRGAAEVAILSTEGDGLVRMKAALNVLNTAQFSLRAKGTMFCVESAVAMMAIGESDNGEDIRFVGHVILPWCRPSGRDSVVSSSRSSSTRVVMCEGNDWTFKRVGEGHRTLYELVRLWWEQLELTSLEATVEVTSKQVPTLPWPCTDVDLPFLSEILRFQGAHRIVSINSPLDRLKHAEMMLIVPVKWRISDVQILNVLVTWAFSIRDCQTKEKPDDASFPKFFEKRLTSVVSHVVSFALRTRVSNTGNSPNGDSHAVPQKSQRVTLTTMSRSYLQLEQSLRETWTDLANYAAHSRSEFRHDDVLFILRHASPNPAYSLHDLPRRVKFYFFDEQLDALRIRLQERSASTDNPGGVFAHFVRCALLLAKSQLSTASERCDTSLTALGNALGELAQYFGTLPGTAKEVFLRCVDARAFPDDTVADIWHPAKTDRLSSAARHAFNEFIENAADWQLRETAWNHVRTVFYRTHFPLDLVISNSIMDTTAMEIVDQWPIDRRVAATPIGDRLDEYPAELLICELGCFSPENCSSLIYVPLIASTTDAESMPPAFGVAMVTPSQVNAVRVAQILQLKTRDIENAVALHIVANVMKRLNLMESESQDARRPTPESREDLKDMVSRGIVGLHSLSTRVEQAVPFPDDSGDRFAKNRGLPVARPFVIQRGLGGRPDSGVSLEMTTEPAAFHTLLCELLSGIASMNISLTEMDVWSDVLPAIAHNMIHVESSLTLDANTVEHLLRKRPACWEENSSAAVGSLKKAVNDLKRYRERLQSAIRGGGLLRKSPTTVKEAHRMIVDGITNLKRHPDFNHVAVDVDCRLIGNLIIDLDGGWFQATICDLVENSLEAFLETPVANPSVNVVVGSHFSEDSGKPLFMTVRVIDNGPGIPADVPRSVNDGKPCGTHKRQHFGIGMLLAKRFAKQHDGDLIFGNPPTGSDVELRVRCSEGA